MHRIFGVVMVVAWQEGPYKTGGLSGNGWLRQLDCLPQNKGQV